MLKRVLSTYLPQKYQQNNTLLAYTHSSRIRRSHKLNRSPQRSPAAPPPLAPPLLPSKRTTQQRPMAAPAGGPSAAAAGDVWQLHYWPGVKGRGEYVRLCFEEAGVPYTDVAYAANGATASAAAGGWDGIVGTPGFKVGALPWGSGSLGSRCCV